MAPPTRANKNRRSGNNAGPDPTAAPEVGAIAGVGADRISALPSEVLGGILSLLPTDEAVRAQAVSRVWRTLWPTAPLNLDDDHLRRRLTGAGAGADDALLALITRILAAHRGPARRLSLTMLPRISSTTGGDRYGVFRALLQSPTLDALQDIHFSYLYKSATATDDLDRLPPPALRFGGLTVASYGRCHFPENLAGVRFPKLRQLTLYDLTNTERTLHDMISACPEIRSLLLNNNRGFRRARISSPTLVSLGVSSDEDAEAAVMEELTIVDAPCMERLLIFNADGGPMNISVVGAPKLRVLGSVPSFVLKLQLGKTVLKEMTAITAITSMHAMTILAIGGDGFKLNIVIDILRCFPFLEKLYFTSMAKEGYGKTVPYNGDLSIKCLDTHLKEIVLRNYKGTREDVKFAKFFILNASALRLLKFQVPIRQCHKKWEANERRKLPKKNDRASPAVRFHFVYDTVFFRNFEDANRTHKILKSDPFDG
ncbi:unnamed protein product [Urochloa humidicola]